MKRERERESSEENAGRKKPRAKKRSKVEDSGKEWSSVCFQDLCGCQEQEPAASKACTTLLNRNLPLEAAASSGQEEVAREQATFPIVTLKFGKQDFVWFR